jgi:hypothetical protein
MVQNSGNFVYMHLKGWDWRVLFHFLKDCVRFNQNDDEFGISKWNLDRDYLKL